MKTISNNVLIALFLAFISQGIQAQFDDIYYDPDKDSKPVESRYYEEDKDGSQDGQKNLSHETDPDDEGYYDDTNGEWEDQEYYYTSRIKRFYRPAYGFGYYDPFYTYNYYYDPYDFDPWYYDRDIYSSSWRFNFYTGPIRWSNYYSYRPFWSYWDACYGWNNYHHGYYGSYHGYNTYWGSPYYYYNSPHYYSHNKYRDQDKYADNGYHYGSRRFGTTNTSKRGPVRLSNPSPREITETTGVNANPGRTNDAPRRVVRSADGDASNDKLMPGIPNTGKRPLPRSNPSKELSDGKHGYEKIDRSTGRDPQKWDDREMNAQDKFKDERNIDNSKLRPHRMERSFPSEDKSRNSRMDAERRTGRDRSAQPDINLPRQRQDQDRSGFGSAIMDALGGSKSKGNNSSSGGNSGKSSKSESPRKGPR